MSEPEPWLVALLAGVAIGLAIGLVALLVWRFARGSRELGSDAERATYRTLNLASRAARDLRSGLVAGDAPRAARHLRDLLGCDALAVVDSSGVVALEGPAALRDVAAATAARLGESARTQVVAVRGGPSAIAAPIVVDGLIVGTIVAFTTAPRAPLIRATGDVAEWVAAQLGLGELDASRAALAEAELRALRAQISPHFIYNALTAIASFITTDPGKARELVVEFADFTRYSFRRQGDFTTLAEELRSIHSYLLLERARFGERLEVTLQVAPEILSTVIPFLSLQPLVENSVRHGAESREGAGRITITAEDAGTHAEITVEDDGGGMDPDMLAALLAGQGGDEHVGLRNVDTRLRQLYGQEHGLVIETNVGAGTLVRMRLPKSQPLHDATRIPDAVPGAAP